MLLHRLTEYAERAEAEDELLPPYYRPKRVQWILQLNKDGTAASVEDLRPGNGEKPKEAPAPYVYRSGTMPPPCLMVDTAQFVLAVPKPPQGKPVTAREVEEGRRRRDAYAALLLAWADAAPGDPYAEAVRTFVTTGVLQGLKAPEAMTPTDNIALVADDNTWLHLLSSAQEMWAATVRSRKSGKGSTGLCLVCGKDGELLATIPESIKAGTIPSPGRGRDAQLVSINASAQGRGGAVQLINTPVCERCGGRAMAALNLLLSSKSNCRRTADSVTVWWTRDPVDDLFVLDTATDATVARLLDSLHQYPDPATAERSDPNAYYALALGLNNARAVVLDWLDIPVGRLRNHLGAWFEHHRVFDGWKRRYRYLPLWHLALAAGRWDAKANKYVSGSTPKGLEQELLHAALTRGPVPARLLPHLLQRIRADRRVDHPRTALLRLALHQNRKEHQVTAPADRLDLSQLDSGYLCGRVFAVLEAIQYAALPDVKATIGDKFFGTAMTAPAAVLKTLRQGANAHLKRLRRDRPAAHAALSKTLAETFAAFDAEDGIPLLLTTRQQAWFVLGYEQQRAEDFAARAARKKNKDEGEDTSEDPAVEDE